MCSENQRFLVMNVAGMKIATYVGNCLRICCGTLIAVWTNHGYYCTALKDILQLSGNVNKPRPRAVALGLGWFTA